MVFFYGERDTNDFIKLIDDGVHTDKITQFVKKTQSDQWSTSTSYGEENYDDDTNEGGHEGSNDDANEGEEP